MYSNSLVLLFELRFTIDTDVWWVSVLICLFIVKAVQVLGGDTITSD